MDTIILIILFCHWFMIRANAIYIIKLERKLLQLRNDFNHPGQ